MNLNVLTDFPYTKRHYLTHPWQWFKHLFINIRDFWYRGKNGFAPRDTWEFCDWWPRVTAAAIRYLAENANGWPDGEFKTYEEWKDWLHSVADVLESTLEDNWAGQNEYEKDWHRIVIEDFGKHPNLTTTSTYTEEDKERIRKLYWGREVELEEQRQKLQKETLHSVVEKLPMLWD